MKNRLIVQSLFLVVLFAVAGMVSAQNALFVDAQGEVGIGTASPLFPLHVIATSAPSNTVLQLDNGGPARFRFKNTVNNETWNVGHQSPSGTGLVFSDVGDGTSELLLDVNGNLTIAGSLTTLSPAGTFPDYVFAPEYELMPLAKLSEFVRENRHLPNVPSASDVASAGKLNVNELQMKMLEKIEELTLYTLQQQKHIEELSAKVAELQRATTASPASNVQ